MLTRTSETKGARFRPSEQLSGDSGDVDDDDEEEEEADWDDGNDEGSENGKKNEIEAVEDESRGLKTHSVVISYPILRFKWIIPRANLWESTLSYVDVFKNSNVLG